MEAVLKTLIEILKLLKLFDKHDHKVVYHRAACSHIEFCIEELSKEIQRGQKLAEPENKGK